MLEIFSYDFMLRAFGAGIIIAVIAPLLGTFLIAKRYALIVDTLAHTSLAGIGLGIVLGVYPLYTALLVAMLSAITIEYLRTKKGISGEAALAMFLSGGLALAVILSSLGKGSNVDLFSYLFGSITTVQNIDLIISGILGLTIISIIILNYKSFFYLAFDEEGAKISGVRVGVLNFLLIALTALTVVISIRVVGALLVGALTVIPVITSSQIARSFKQSILLSIMFGLLSVIGGLFASYYINIPAGGAIVILSFLIFGLTIVLKPRS